MFEKLWDILKPAMGWPASPGPNIDASLPPVIVKKDDPNAHHAREGFSLGMGGSGLKPGQTQPRTAETDAASDVTTRGNHVRPKPNGNGAWSDGQLKLGVFVEAMESDGRIYAPTMLTGPDGLPVGRANSPRGHGR